MTIGDKVTATNRLIKITQIRGTSNRIISWKPHPLVRPVPVGIYLGTVTLYDGNVEWSGDDEQGNMFVRTGQISAVAVQPLDGNRYRRPVYALPSDVEAHP